MNILDLLGGVAFEVMPEGSKALINGHSAVAVDDGEDLFEILLGRQEKNRIPRHVANNACERNIPKGKYCKNHKESQSKDSRKPEQRKYNDNTFTARRPRSGAQEPIIDIVNMIDRVIFSDPATIVLWKDGVKTIVRCGNSDIYDKEKGLCMAILKRLDGNTGNFHRLFIKFCPEIFEDKPEQNPVTEMAGVDINSILDEVNVDFDGQARPEETGPEGDPE